MSHTELNPVSLEDLTNTDLEICMLKKDGFQLLSSLFWASFNWTTICTKRLVMFGDLTEDPRNSIHLLENLNFTKPHSNIFGFHINEYMQNMAPAWSNEVYSRIWRFRSTFPKIGKIFIWETFQFSSNNCKPRPLKVNGSVHTTNYLHFSGHL